uniref:helix-turn-helix domain-containing protein n=1 Tax=Arthrobacter sp. ERGS1:01 TaxID=1704044 RepID=UPI000AB374F8|nr:helix-turn-helix domain-containing protein [Arthrobacter sp. ERGS1:01]
MHSKTQRIAKEARFWVLMAQGSTLIAACNVLGVDRRTGRRWRQATGGRIPRKKPEPSGRYLSLDERLRIADLHLSGSNARSIAVQMNRSASTTSRELRRNGPARGVRSRGTYAPHAAQKKAELRGCRPKGSKFDDVELSDLMQAKLCVKWSPRQISDHLTARFPDRAQMRVSPETIY